jgi:hypothetical protein
MIEQHDASRAAADAQPDVPDEDVPDEVDV